MDEHDKTKDENVPALIRNFLQQEKMTAGELARSLNVNETTVQRWLKGEAKPTGTAAAVLGILIGLGEAAFNATGSTFKMIRGISIPSSLVTGAAVGAGAIAGGWEIYKLLKRKFQQVDPDGTLQETLDQELALLNEKAEQEQKITDLRTKLAAEEKRLQEMLAKLQKKPE